MNTISTCRVCNEKNELELIVARDYFLGTKKKYDYFHCHSCGSLSIKTVPSDLNKLYEKYYSFEAPRHVSTIRFVMHSFLLNCNRKLSKLVLPFLKKQDDLPIKSLRHINMKKNLKILDVGCGSGSLLSFLDKIGYHNCLGIDPFLKGTIKISPNLLLKKTGFLDVSGKYDLIMFHHVFEHFISPLETLHHVHDIMSDSGVCVIRIPNVDSYSYRRFKEKWFSIHAPFHFFLPSRKGFDSMLESSGLYIEKSEGEQLPEFFLYSNGHELGVSDYEKYGSRRIIEKSGLKSLPPFYTKKKRKEIRERTKQVVKYDLCDWIVYYIRKSSYNSE